jgi:hypothetical protein
MNGLTAIADSFCSSSTRACRVRRTDEPSLTSQLLSRPAASHYMRPSPDRIALPQFYFGVTPGIRFDVENAMPIASSRPVRKIVLIARFKTLRTCVSAASVKADLAPAEKAAISVNPFTQNVAGSVVVFFSRHMRSCLDRFATRFPTSWLAEKQDGLISVRCPLLLYT